VPIREAWEDRDREKSRRRERIGKKKGPKRTHSGRPRPSAPEITDFEDEIDDDEAIDRLVDEWSWEDVFEKEE